MVEKLQATLEFHYPKDEQQHRACVEYLKDYNMSAALVRSGYSQAFVDSKKGFKLFNRLSKYIAKLDSEKNQQLTKHIAIEQSEVLHLVSVIARANALDYIQSVEVETDTLDGNKVILNKFVQKPLESLTRDQAAAIDKVFTKPDGTIGYQLHDKTKALQLAMRHYGMLSERLIAEHLHKHLHIHADLRDVPTEKLVMLEEAFVKILGPQAAQALGVQREQTNTEVIENKNS